MIEAKKVTKSDFVKHMDDMTKDEDPTVALTGVLLRDCFPRIMEIIEKDLSNGNVANPIMGAVAGFSIMFAEAVVDMKATGSEKRQKDLRDAYIIHMTEAIKKVQLMNDKKPSPTILPIPTELDEMFDTAANIEVLFAREMSSDAQ